MEESIIGYRLLASITQVEMSDRYVGKVGVAIYTLPMLCQNMSPECCILAPCSLSIFPICYPQIFMFDVCYSVKKGTRDCSQSVVLCI